MNSIKKQINYLLGLKFRKWFHRQYHTLHENNIFVGQHKVSPKSPINTQRKELQEEKTQELKIVPVIRQSLRPSGLVNQPSVNCNCITKHKMLLFPEKERDQVFGKFIFPSTKKKQKRGRISYSFLSDFVQLCMVF